VARAQQKRMPVIGALAVGGVAWLGFSEGLSQTGFIDGQNVRLEYRYGEYTELPSFATDLARLNVNLIVAFGTNAAIAAKQATKVIPIVFQSGDPVADGLVTSLARPGGNLTGVSLLDAPLMPKRLELLSELVPRHRVFALLVNPNLTTAADVIEATQDAARDKKIELHVLKATTLDEIQTAIQTAAELHVDGLILGIDPFFNYGGGSRVTVPAAAHAIPAIYGSSDIVWSGGLMSYGPSLTAMRQQMGILAGRVLKGEKPADLPVEEPSKYELVINLKTAKAIGLTVPQTLLARADEVIE
jgi:ABC-type uncharacterized transport system substrate-binding protein